MAEATTIKRHMLFEGHEGSWHEEGRVGTWLANTDGTSFRPAAYTWGNPPALAPDGRTVAFSLGDELKREDISGASEQTLYTAGAGYSISAARYSSDGKTLIFVKEHESSAAIVVINADGSEPKTVVSGLFANHVAPDFSPDETKIVYTSGEGGTSLVVANVDGSEPKIISTGLEHVHEPRFSPGGTKIAFSGWSTSTLGENEEEWMEPQIFTVNATGAGLKQIAYDEFGFAPEWSPNGARIFYTGYKAGGQEQVYSSKADGTGEEQLLEPSGFSYTRFAAFTPGDIGDDEYLGLNYAPILRFDSAEKWRPLNVDAFMREEDPENEGHSYNQLCAVPGCDELGAEWESEVAFSEGEKGPRYIKMGRQAPETYLEPTSPISECHAEVVIELWDCDTGPRTAMYYHVLPSANEEETSELGYNYVDYWIFYRYNLGFTVDDHEGDWEGLTVAPSVSAPGTIDFAILAQHKEHYVYMPEMLECDEGGEASCGSSESPQGERVWDYVAVGSHASYPEADAGGESEICTQHGSELPDGCHDGEVPWGANGDAANILQLPPSGDAKWSDWRGVWGDDASPESPGLQVRYKCPWKWYEADPTACPAKAKVSEAAAREMVASACGNWFGGSIVATACSPAVLRHAVQTARMSQPGTLHIRLGHRAGRSGSRLGVAQASGAPLGPGEFLTVDGQAPADTTLLVRARASGHLVEAAFSHLGLTHGGRGVVKALRTRAGVRLVWIGKDGRSAAPSRARTTRVARQVLRPATPRHADHSASSSHSVAHAAAAPSPAFRQAAGERRACERVAASDRRQLKALARSRRDTTVRPKIRELHEKLAYGKC
jgi:hypothetical protein